MDTASLQFVLFGLTAAVVSNFSRSRVWRSIVLFAASVGFLYLLAHDPILFIPLAGFLLLGYLAIVLVQRGWSRMLSVAVIAVILVFIWLKKYTLLPVALFINSIYFTLGI